MKHKKHIAFLGSIFLFILVITSGVFFQEYVRRNGQEVILATVPVDPRDILRGDYLELAYEIGRGEKAVHFVKTLEHNTIVYALLTLDGTGRIQEYSFSTVKPKNGSYIQGKARVHTWERYEYEDSSGMEKLITEKNGTIYYPQIEQYFVPEGKGWSIDRMGRWDANTKLEVRIALYRGRGQILDLLVNGNPLDFSQIEAENPWR